MSASNRNGQVVEVVLENGTRLLVPRSGAGQFSPLLPLDLSSAWPAANKDGETAAVLGQAVRFRSSQRGPGDYRHFTNKVHCAGPYWGVSGIEAVK